MKQINKEWFGSQSKIIEQTDDYIVIDYGCVGHGIITVYSLFKGIQLCFMEIETPDTILSKIFSPDIIQITYCQKGRYECEFSNHTVSYLAEGCFSVAGTRYLPRSISFPLKTCHAVSLVIDKQNVSTEFNEIMNVLPINIEKLGESLGLEKQWYVASASPKLQHLFHEIYQAKGIEPIGYFRIKAIELLYHIDKLRQIHGFDFKYFDRGQIQSTKRICAHLIEHLEEKLPLEQLAKEEHLSLATFYLIFSRIYGDTPYAYIKKYKMNLAAKMLTEKNMKMCDIALELGYNNASKFSKAFYSVFHTLPSEYKKCKKNGLN